MHKTVTIVALALGLAAAQPSFAQQPPGGPNAPDMKPRPESCQHALLHAETDQKEDVSNVITPGLRNHVARARAALDGQDEAGCLAALSEAKRPQRGLPN